MYKSIIKPILFRFQPETAHNIVFSSLKFLFAIPLVKPMVRSVFEVKHKSLERTVFGLKFPNPVGLAAGFDKDAKLYKELACLGFGFIEIGTLTPVGQPGNPQPRSFRLPKDEALINRMGFNNEGVQAAVERLRKRDKSLIIGGNIGKNKVTPNEEAVSDYEKCFTALYPYVDYFVVNVAPIISELSVLNTALNLTPERVEQLTITQVIIFYWDTVLGFGPPPLTAQEIIDLFRKNINEGGLPKASVDAYFQSVKIAQKYFPL